MALTQISTAGVKDDAVTAGKIPADAIGSSEIAANAVGSSELADNAVDTAAIANNAVTAGKLASGITDLSNDTSPQLGGNLSSNGNNINMADSDIIVVGSGNDLQISHSSSVTNIRGATANDIKITTAKDFFIQHADTDGSNAENIIACSGDGTVELYHNGAEKLATTAGGIELKGVENAGSQFRLGASSDFQIEHDGSNSYIYNLTNDLVIQNDAAVKITAKSGGTPRFRFDTDGLKFGSDTAAANALDDYEEGTWTPANSDMGVTVHYARYTKIGRMVHIVADVEFASSPADSSQVGYLTGLPFTNGNKSVHQHLPWFGTSSANNNQFFNTWFTPLIFANDDKFSFLDSRYGIYLSRATLASKKVRINSTYYTSY